MWLHYLPLAKAKPSAGLILSFFCAFSYAQIHLISPYTKSRIITTKAQYIAIGEAAALQGLKENISSYPKETASPLLTCTGYGTAIEHSAQLCQCKLGLGCHLFCGSLPFLFCINTYPMMIPLLQLYLPPTLAPSEIFLMMDLLWKSYVFVLWNGKKMLSSVR